MVLELLKAAMFPDMLPNPRPVVLRETMRVATVLIDTEEDFDWADPTEGTDYATAYLTRIADLQPVFTAHGVVPTYLVTYPVLENPDVVRLLARYRDRGEAALGLQLHPWVTPPFEGHGTTAQSFGGNLAPEVEARKLDSLSRRFSACFGAAPLVFRAGRYGLGRQTAALIEQAGITIDTSVAPRTSMIEEAGPDYSRIDFVPFWFGAERPILELPLGRAIVGWGGGAGSRLYRRLIHARGKLTPLAGVLARLGCAERITLSPEGNDPRAMIRLVEGLTRRGQAILPLSFHSSSIVPGRNPYVRSRADLHRFYDDLSSILCTLSDDFGCRFAAVTEIPALLRPAPPVGAAGDSAS
ncbi:polysaccharide deacetylase family protein [Acidiphilium sp.]|uniref:polysaccharide deacetylase family protein n=1 Tax=Acidiphilium sp. TaxID=527 RepID=UPI003CFC3A03